MKLGDKTKLDKTFISTTPYFEQAKIFADDAEFGEGILFEFVVKKNTSVGAYTAEISNAPEEREFLLKLGLSYKVISKDTHDAIIKIGLEILE